MREREKKKRKKEPKDKIMNNAEKKKGIRRERRADKNKETGENINNR